MEDEKRVCQFTGRQRTDAPKSSEALELRVPDGNGGRKIINLAARRTNPGSPSKDPIYNEPGFMDGDINFWEASRIASNLTPIDIKKAKEPRTDSFKKPDPDGPTAA